MDYFKDVLTTFLALNVSVALLSMEVRKLSDFIKNILTCVLKMREGLNGFGTAWGSVINDRISFFGELSLLISQMLTQEHYLYIIHGMVFTETF